jgi:hypothetical protein
VKRVYDSTTTVYVFLGYKVIAEYHQDQLSNRLVTDSAGNTVEQIGHYPFGDPWYNASNDKLVFTTYERDSESGNDYAQARF